MFIALISSMSFRPYLSSLSMMMLPDPQPALQRKQIDASRKAGLKPLPDTMQRIGPR